MVAVEEWKVKDIAKQINKLLKSDWDVVLAGDGTEGSGKSTLFLDIAQAQNGKNFQLEKNVIFYPTIDEVNERYDHGPRYSGYVWDEAVRLLYKLNWASKTSKSINEKFAVVRSQNKATYLLIPRYWDLNEYFRNHRVSLWLHVIDRGVAVIKSKDFNEYTDDPWHRAENDKIIRKAQGFKRLSSFTLQDKIKIERKTKGFEAVIYWEPRKDETWDQYEILKKTKGYSTEEVLTNPRTLRIQTAYLKGITDVKTLAEIEGCSTRCIYHILRDIGLTDNTSHKGGGPRKEDIIERNKQRHEKLKKNTNIADISNINFEKHIQTDDIEKNKQQIYEKHKETTNIADISNINFEKSKIIDDFENLRLKQPLDNYHNTDPTSTNQNLAALIPNRSTITERGESVSVQLLEQEEQHGKKNKRSNER